MTVADVNIRVAGVDVPEEVLSEKIRARENIFSESDFRTGVLMKAEEIPDEQIELYFEQTGIDVKERDMEHTFVRRQNKIAAKREEIDALDQ